MRSRTGLVEPRNSARCPPARCRKAKGQGGSAPDPPAGATGVPNTSRQGGCSATRPQCTMSIAGRRTSQFGLAVGSGDAHCRPVQSRPYEIEHGNCSRRRLGDTPHDRQAQGLDTHAPFAHLDRSCPAGFGSLPERRAGAILLVGVVVHFPDGNGAVVDRAGTSVLARGAVADIHRPASQSRL